MRSLFDSLVLQRTLAQVDSRRYGAMGDALEFELEDDEAPILRNLCFKVWPIVWDELDEVIKLLGVSKRRFCEAAMVDAIDRAKAIMAAEGFTAVDREIALSAAENGHD